MQKDLCGCLIRYSLKITSSLYSQISILGPLDIRASPNVRCSYRDLEKMRQRVRWRCAEDGRKWARDRPVSPRDPSIPRSLDSRSNRKEGQRREEGRRRRKIWRKGTRIEPAEQPGKGGQLEPRRYNDWLRCRSKLPICCVVRCPNSLLSLRAGVCTSTPLSVSSTCARVHNEAIRACRRTKDGSNLAERKACGETKYPVSGGVSLTLRSYLIDKLRLIYPSMTSGLARRRDKN